MFIAIDLGGTNTRIAVSNDNDSIVTTETFPSLHNLPEQRAKIHQTLLNMAGDNVIKGVCLGVPGIVDRDENKIITAPNYPELDGIFATELLGGNIDGLLLLENDTALGALGESVRGAGVDSKAVAYLALGTGVGGAIIENGHINNRRTMSEPGHMIINFDAEVFDNMGYSGSLEAYVSGTAFAKLYNMKPENCTDRNVWSDFGKVLAVGIANINSMWGPDKIVIGGGLSNKFDYFIEGVQTKLAEYSKVKFPEIVKSRFGDTSGIVGGFVHLAQNLE